jgi:hypothetical protein
LAPSDEGANFCPGYHGLEIESPLADDWCKTIAKVRLTTLDERTSMKPTLACSVTLRNLND